MYFLGDSNLELEYEEKCQSNQYAEEKEPCNTWTLDLDDEGQRKCTSPCDQVCNMPIQYTCPKNLFDIIQGAAIDSPPRPQKFSPSKNDSK